MGGEAGWGRSVGGVGEGTPLSRTTGISRHTSPAFPQCGCGSCAGTLCPQLQNNTLYLAPAPKNLSTSGALFPPQNFHYDDVKSAVKRTESRSGIWSRQDVIMRYRRHRVLFLTLSFPNWTTFTASTQGLMCEFGCVPAGKTVLQLVSDASHVCLLITSPSELHAALEKMRWSLRCRYRTTVTVLCADCKHTPALIFGAPISGRANRTSDIRAVLKK